VDTIFDFVAGALEQASRLDRLEARGTLRIALREAGLDARSVTRAQMTVVLQRILSRELASRGIESPGSVCESLVTALKGFTPNNDPVAEPDAPEEVFRRLGSR
jgi:hypothetical protein